MPKYNLETSVDTIYEDIQADLRKVFEDVEEHLYHYLYDEVYKLCLSYLEETNRLTVIDLIKHINREMELEYEVRYPIFANEVIEDLERDMANE